MTESSEWTVLPQELVGLPAAHAELLSRFWQAGVRGNFALVHSIEDPLLDHLIRIYGHRAGEFESVQALLEEERRRKCAGERRGLLTIVLASVVSSVVVWGVVASLLH